MDGDHKKTIRILMILSSLVGAPTVLIFFTVFVVVLFILGLFVGKDSDSSNNCVTLPTVDSVCKSITVEGQGTMDLDEYVAGVINAEVGGMVDTNFNTYKAAAVAARSYVLANANKDSSGNCSVSSSQSFQVFKENPDDNMKNAATETSGMVMVKDGKVYSTQYDAFCYSSKDSSNYQVCQGNGSTTSIPVQWVESHVPAAYRAAPNDRSVSHGNGMSQYGAFYLASEENKEYKEILEHFYGDDGATLASINSSSSNCNSSLTTLENYNLRHQNLNVLNRTLSQSEINDLNNYLNQEIAKAGHGSGNAVAAAGQSLVYWLEKKGYYLQYRWGGGHGGYGDGNYTFVGANPNWGSSKFGCDSGHEDRCYWGMDCSGFVSWATRTACNESFGAGVSYTWVPYGNRISLKDAKPGDVIAWSEHIQLIVKNNGDGSVIVAEEAGGSTSGLVFSEISSTNHKVVDMKNWYANHCTNITPGTGSSNNDNSSSKSSAVLINPSHQIGNDTVTSNKSKYGTEKKSMFIFGNLVKNQLESSNKNAYISLSDGSIDSGDKCWDSSDSGNGQWEKCANKQIKYLINKSNNSNTVYIALHSNASNGKGMGPAIYYADGHEDSKKLAEKLCDSIKKVYKNNSKTVNTDCVQPGGKVSSEARRYYEQGGKGTAVLIEIGFHDNADNQRLIENKGRELAAAVISGINNYLNG